MANQTQSLLISACSGSMVGVPAAVLMGMLWAGGFHSVIDVVFVCFFGLVSGGVTALMVTSCLSGFARINSLPVLLISGTLSAAGGTPLMFIVLLFLGELG
jgi:hypothetical protein